MNTNVDDSDYHKCDRDPAVGCQLGYRWKQLMQTPLTRKYLTLSHICLELFCLKQIEAF